MYREDRDALAERVRMLEQELAAARGELEAAHISLKAREERALLFEKEADALRAGRGWSRKIGSDTWLGAAGLGFAAGAVVMLLLIMMASGR